MVKNTTPATEALNEEDYINKLYDSAKDKQKQLLMDAYTGNQGTLDTEQQRVQQQTDTNVQRTDVEAQKLAEAYSPRNTSDNITAQAELAMGNQQRKNVSTLRDAQNEADYEIERQRQLLGQQYAEAIKKAQADNDLARAQQLYAEAKAKEAEFQAMRADAGKLMAGKGDNSILEEMAAGTSTAAGFSGGTADAVLRNEEAINSIYDSADESSRAENQMVLDAMLSKLQADRDASTRATDQKLTDVYVNALRQGKNYDEVQNASGLGSGNMAQARLARMLGTTEDLTALRGAQMGTDAQIGQQEFGTYQTFRDAVQQSENANEQKRIAALLEAAKGEEQNAADAQMKLAKTMAQQGDYSLLGKLYGLTQDQIDLLMGVDNSGKNQQPQQTQQTQNTTKTPIDVNDIWNRNTQYSGVGSASDRNDAAALISAILASDSMANRGSQSTGVGTVKAKQEEEAANALISAILANDLMSRRHS